MSKKYILVLTLMLASLGTVKADGLVKGTFSETIDEVEHEKVIEYGKPGLYDVQSMLGELGITLNEEDRVKTFPDPKLGIGSRIEILRATPITVNDAGEITTYRTWKTELSDFFEEQNIVLGTDDVVDPGKTGIIIKDMNVGIIRVSLSELKESEEIDYETINENDASMDRGTTATKQSGEKGKKVLNYMVRRENGKEIERNFVGSEVVKEPVPKIILHGTKVTVLGKGKATWYDWISGNTAASNVLPHGTKVLVRNNANGAEIEVTIIDHGIQGDAIIDLSADAFEQIGDLGDGIIWVTLERP